METARYRILSGEMMLLTFNSYERCLLFYENKIIVFNDINRSNDKLWNQWTYECLRCFIPVMVSSFTSRGTACLLHRETNSQLNVEIKLRAKHTRRYRVYASMSVDKKLQGNRWRVWKETKYRNLIDSRVRELVCKYDYGPRYMCIYDTTHCSRLGTLIHKYLCITSEEHYLYVEREFMS